MTLLDLLRESPCILISVVFIIGLMVGSFLNVVIFRLPLMMNRTWRKECHEFLQLAPEPSEPAVNLLFPGSHCPQCQTAIKAYQNIPILSFAVLRGKCAHCGHAISLRYPLIEALTGICSAMIAWHFGYGPALLWALILTWGLIAASFIDIDHQLLPDSITQPLLWLGLFLSLFPLYTDPSSSIIGAIAGYLTLWTVFQLFKLATGKEGMGYGDFKLLAVFGAWLGWQYLPIIILISSLVGAIIGIIRVILAKQDRNTPIPFGPYLATAGWIALLWGDEINQLYLHSSGL